MRPGSGIGKVGYDKLLALTPFLTTCDPRHGIKIREMVNVEMFPDSDCLKRIMNVAEFSKDDRAMRYTMTSSFSSIASKCCIAALEEFRRLFLRTYFESRDVRMEVVFGDFPSLPSGMCFLLVNTISI